MTAPPHQRARESIAGQESLPLDQAVPPAVYFERFCRRNGASTDFGELIVDLDPLDDDQLCEAIEADGRNRITFGMPVRLARYLDAVPDLPERRDPLDAAVDVTLRSLSGSARVSANAVESLAAEYPDLETIVREAAILNNALWSTSDVRRDVQGRLREVPEDFGPPSAGANSRSRYELQRFLGKGSSGNVYLAVDRLLSEPDRPAMVAIKILDLDRSDRAARSRRQLTEEATKARRIDHPNIVRVLDRGVSQDNEDFIVYEYISGGDLYEWLEARGRRPDTRHVVEVLAQVASGVQAAHSAGLVHCDLQPSNILVTPEGVPKVADFGVAVRAAEVRHDLMQSREEGSQHGFVAGSKAYASPEQLRGEEGSLTAPSDIYALGSILFFLLTGQSPNGATLRDFQKITEGRRTPTEAPRLRALRPDLDRDLEAICSRALAPRPEDRYNSAGAFADDLGAWLRKEPIPWTRPSAVRSVSLWARRKPAMAAISALLLVSLIGGIGMVMHTFRLDGQRKDQELRATQAELAREAEALRAVEAELAREAEELRATEAELAREAEAHRALQAERALEGEERRTEVERLRSQHLEEWSVEAARRTTVRMAALKDILEDRASTQFLPVAWNLMYVFGSDVFGTPDEMTDLWKFRFDAVDRLVQQADQNRRGADLEALLWKTTLAFWLVCAGDAGSLDRAEELLEFLGSEWSALLRPDDRWLSQLEVIKAAFAVRRAALSKTEDSSDALAGARDVLELYEPRLAEDDHGSPLHVLALDVMIELYKLVDDHEAHEKAIARHTLFTARPGGGSSAGNGR